MSASPGTLSPLGGEVENRAAENVRRCAVRSADATRNRLHPPDDWSEDVTARCLAERTAGISSPHHTARVVPAPGGLVAECVHGDVRAGGRPVGSLVWLQESGRLRDCRGQRHGGGGGGGRPPPAPTMSTAAGRAPPRVRRSMTERRAVLLRSASRLSSHKRGTFLGGAREGQQGQLQLQP
jgi:hypothetical protein